MAGRHYDGPQDFEGDAPRPTGARVENIASSLDRVDYAIESLQEVAERTRQRLAPVLHRHPIDEADDGMKSPGDDTRSDLNQALNERAERLVRIVNQIREMNERIDL